MPELPEVERVRRELSDLTGQQITATPIAEPDRWMQAGQVDGMRIQALERQGKYLIVVLGEDGHDEELLAVVHLGMTGQLTRRTSPPGTSEKHVRMHWEIDGGRVHLVLADARGFGSVRLARRDELRGPAWKGSTLARLGQDPISDDWDEQEAGRQLARRSSGKAVKAALLEQRAIAGIGNYVADESLWRAGIHPAASGISVEDATQIASAVRAVMLDSLARGGMSMRDYVGADGTAGSYAQDLDCYGRSGQECRRCGQTLVKTHVAGRGTVHCPTCQPETQ